MEKEYLDTFIRYLIRMCAEESKGLVEAEE